MNTEIVEADASLAVLRRSFERSDAGSEVTEISGQNVADLTSLMLLRSFEIITFKTRLPQHDPARGPGAGGPRFTLIGPEPLFDNVSLGGGSCGCSQHPGKA